MAGKPGVQIKGDDKEDRISPAYIFNAFSPLPQVARFLSLDWIRLPSCDLCASLRNTNFASSAYCCKVQTFSRVACAPTHPGTPISLVPTKHDRTGPPAGRPICACCGGVGCSSLSL